MRRRPPRSTRFPYTTLFRSMEFQSTPPRGGRRHSVGRRRPGRNVSIHAPARGATRQNKHPRHFGRVSIHAPARGATACQGESRHDTRSFNPRPRAGGDSVSRPGDLWICGFNPRPRAGGDDGHKKIDRAGICFNPRPRAGGDCYFATPWYQRVLRRLFANLLPTAIVFSIMQPISLLITT